MDSYRQIWYNSIQENMQEENLGDWLITQCNRRGLAWSEASRQAGVAPNTISLIVGGTPAGVKRLTALASYFDVDVEFLMRLSGMLPPRPDSDEIDPELRYKAEELLAIWRRLKAIDPESADRLVGIAILQGEMVMAAARAGGVTETGEKERAEIDAVPS
jgi:transcriptional regulator with XRE-family HTH domain